VLEDLSSGDFATFLEIVGVDPGGKKLVTTAKARLRKPTDDKPDPADFKNKLGTVECSKKYRHDSLAVAAERYEVGRRAANPEYRAALQQYDDCGGSLTAPGQHRAYVAALYKGLAAMRAELFTVQRLELKFARARARDRTLSRIARSMAGRDPDIHSKKTGPATEEVTAARQRVNAFLGKRAGHVAAPQWRVPGEPGEQDRFHVPHSRTRLRIVFFGSALFGQCRAGPLPRKALLRVLGQLCPVVLTDEYYTSKKCAGGCGDLLKQVQGSRVFRCDNSQRDASGSCCVTFIDRDVNGAVNIAMVGVYMLLGRTRPHYLVRPTRPASVVAAEAAIAQL
jgi:hypothetical protein